MTLFKDQYLSYIPAVRGKLSVLRCCTINPVKKVKAYKHQNNLKYQK